MLLWADASALPASLFQLWLVTGPPKESRIAASAAAYSAAAVAEPICGECSCMHGDWHEMSEQVEDFCASATNKPFELYSARTCRLSYFG